MKTTGKTKRADLYKQISDLIISSRNAIIKTVNSGMTSTYFYIGKIIVDKEQKGELRANYAKRTLTILSEKLTAKFGRGFSTDNLERMRNFYTLYSYRISATLSRKSDNEQISGTAIQKFNDSEISATVSRKSDNEQISHFLPQYSELPFNLSWSHYVVLMAIDNGAERDFYEIESLNQNWSVRELKRQYNSSL